MIKKLSTTINRCCCCVLGVVMLIVHTKQYTESKKTDLINFSMAVKLSTLQLLSVYYK